MSSEHTEPQQSPDRVSGAGARLRAPLVVQFMKFGIVGVSNTLLTFAVYGLLLKVFGVWYLAASAVGLECGAVVRLAGHDDLVAAADPSDALGRQPPCPML